MENPKYILLMRQVASDFDGISHELFQIANDLERIEQFNPQQKLFVDLGDGIDVYDILRRGEMK